MRKSNTRRPISLAANNLLLCAGIGLLLGEMVGGISAHHQASLTGLTVALVMVLSGGASLVFWLMHQHQQQHPPELRAPVAAWLLALGSGLLVSLLVLGAA